MNTDHKSNSTKYNALVLGAGMVGRVMAEDLAADADYSVSIADINSNALNAFAGSPITTVEIDLSDSVRVQELVSQYDIILGALSSSVGYKTLDNMVEAGVNYCDISFMPEDGTQLSRIAEKRGVTAVIDCGVAPGLSHMLAAYGASQLNVVERIEIYVGGLPVERNWPFEYKAGFAPSDVIEEYTRPSRTISNGNIITKKALSEPELLTFPGVGSLEAFNTDGLRSLLHTIDAPEIVEKTLRYPGHCELMRVLRHMGLFSQDPIRVPSADNDGTYVEVKPLDVTSALMFPQWKFDEGEADITVMRVMVDGQQSKGNKVSYCWNYMDIYDDETNRTSMSRSTAFPCVLVAKMIAEGRFTTPGVHTPEVIGQDESLFQDVVRGLIARGIQISSSDPAAY